MSNDVTDFYRMCDSFHFKSGNAVDSFTKNVLFNPPVPPTNRWDDWNVRWKAYHSGEYTDYFSIRQDSLAMAENADIIFVGDDDFIFQEGSSQVIDECCFYMDENKDCGAIYLAANFGDAYKSHGNEIYIINNGHLGTNRGIILRNREVMMWNEFHALGANEDFIIGYTCVLQGYYLCRKLHMPIEHPANNNRIGTSKNSEIDFLMSKGIMSKINKHLGYWADHNQWPEGIFKIYHKNALAIGWKPRYTADGEII
jgi:hypothetical protein